MLNLVQNSRDAVLSQGESGRIELRNFGVFEVKERAARKARNPKTGEEIRRVTISIGVTEHIPGEDIETAIARADEALYRAKANGRNRVEIGPVDETALAASA